MTDKKYVTKDSGHRQEFSTGAQRDRAEGKGRYDLLPAAAIKRIADIFERGALKYAPRNWEQGMPLSRYIDSALRHLFQYLEGRRDEDHLGQSAWNLVACLHTETMIDRGLLPKELDDLPCHYSNEDDDLPTNLEDIQPLTPEEEAKVLQCLYRQDSQDTDSSPKYQMYKINQGCTDIVCDPPTQSGINSPVVPEGKKVVPIEDVETDTFKVGQEVVVQPSYSHLMVKGRITKKIKDKVYEVASPTLGVATPFHEWELTAAERE